MKFIRKIAELGFGANRKQRVFYAFLMLFILFITIYLTTSLLAPIKKLHDLSISNSNQNFGDSIMWSTVSGDPALDSLAKEEAFLKSLLTMTESDSIGIVVDFRDSTIRLELHGVKIHSSRISHFEVDRFFFTMDANSYNSLFSDPFTSYLQTCTIEKEPVTIKNAPKDTIEAAKSVFMPDTNIVPPMFCSMELNAGARFYLIQDSIANRKEWIEKNRFFLRQKSLDFIGNCVSIFHLHIPDYKPAFMIYLPTKDAIAIYRAVPANAQICVRL